jgi:hypothetical protein
LRISKSWPNTNTSVYSSLWIAFAKSAAAPALTTPSLPLPLAEKPSEPLDTSEAFTRPRVGVPVPGLTKGFGSAKHGCEPETASAMSDHPDPSCTSKAFPTFAFCEVTACRVVEARSSFVAPPAPVPPLPQATLAVIARRPVVADATRAARERRDGEKLR